MHSPVLHADGVGSYVQMIKLYIEYNFRGGGWKG